MPLLLLILLTPPWVALAIHHYSGYKPGGRFNR